MTSLSSGSAKLEELLAWWQKTYRPETRASLRHVQVLIQRVRDVVRSARCSRSPTGSPLALTAIECELPGRDYRPVADMKVERLASRSLLRKRIAAAGPALSRNKGAYCGYSPLFRGPWQLDDAVRGTLVCYPYGKYENYIWTLNSARLYLIYSYRGGDEERSFEVWQQHLFAIGAS